MYYSVAQRLSIPTGTDLFSQAVSMRGANAVLVDFVVIVAGTGGTIGVQQSNDLENWGTDDATVAASSVGFGTLRVGTIASQYARLHYKAPTAGTAIITAGINTAML